MTTIRERRIINLNSQNATQNNGSFLSNVSFNFSNIYTLEDNVVSLSGGVLSAQIPVSFYSVNYTNNVLRYAMLIGGILNYYTITITTGFYDYQTLFDEMHLQFQANSHNFVLTLNENNGKMNFHHQGTGDFISIIYNGSTCFSILGFGKQDYLATAENLTAPYPLDLLGIRALKIMCPEFSTNNKDSVNLATTQLIETIPVDQAPYGIIMYSNSNNEYGNLQTQNISTINIQILSELGDFVNFNNTNWTITLVLLIDRIFKVNLINNLDSALSATIIPRITEQPTEIMADQFRLGSGMNEVDFPIEEQTTEFVDEEQPTESSLDQFTEDEELKLLTTQ